MGDGAEQIELRSQIAFTDGVRDSINPYTICGHRLTKPELDSIAAQMFTVHFTHGFHYTDNVRILAKRICTNTLFLDVDFNDFTETVEMLPQLAGRDVLFEVSDKQSSGGLGMVLVQLRLVRSELVIVNVVSLVGGYFNLAAEKQLIVGHLQSLLNILGLFEANKCITIGTLANDLHPRHFAVLLVLVEEAILERSVGRTGR